MSGQLDMCSISLNSLNFIKTKILMSAQNSNREKHDEIGATAIFLHG